MSGCPPDFFSVSCQLCFIPLYDWAYHKETEYDWWMQRIGYCYELYDIVRIDHFRGFDEYYSIPYGNVTAEGGHWEKGPGISVFETMKKKLGNREVIAEDLGFLTDTVKKLVERSGFPGMKILQFAFDSREAGNYMPYYYPSNCVVYTGTHDNDSTRSWFTSAPPADVAVALEYMGLKDDTDGTWSFIRMALNSVADLAVIPMPDYLDLGAKARINTPSTVNSENWIWRMKPGACTKELAQKMARMADLSGRARDLPKAPEKKAKAKKKNKKGEGKDADTQ